MAGLKATGLDCGTIKSPGPGAFNSLAYVVASCVAETENCAKLFQAATPAGKPAPANVLEALANIVKNPSYLGPDDTLAADDPLFDLSIQRRIYQPALRRPPTSWLLFLKITGGFYSAQDSQNLMNGPGNFAIDARGFVWADTNYQPQPAGHFACAGQRLVKFYPWGKNFNGSPYFGGGLSGAGWGIAFDPNGNLWVGNFGFQDPPCAFLPQAATNDSVSLFRPDGTAISPSGGFTRGSISWPQGAVSDRQGNIWVANCGNDSVTKIPGGNPYSAFHIPLGATPAPGQPQIKPFWLHSTSTAMSGHRQPQRDGLGHLPRPADRPAARHLPGQDSPRPPGGRRGRQQGRHLVVN